VWPHHAPKSSVSYNVEGSTGEAKTTEEEEEIEEERIHSIFL
jgi:hypothetical protein